MKKVMILALALCGIGVYAEDGYGVISGGASDSAGYIQISEDLQSFGFTVSESGSKSDGALGYYTYTSDDRSDKTDMGLIDLSDPSKAPMLGSTDAGTKIGFYYQEDGSRVYEYTLQKNPKGDGYQVEFKTMKKVQLGWHTNAAGQNVYGFYTVVTQAKGLNGLLFSNTDTFVVNGISFERGQPTGMPLPGFLVALLLGGLGAGGVASRRRANKKI